MAYVGGKAKSSDHIIKLLNNKAFDDMDYLEPFVGYAHILRRVKHKRSYCASDSNKLLMTLLKAIQNGKPIPDISRSEYYKLKLKTNKSLKRAVAAFTYSYSGKEWGGYVDKYYRNGPKSYAKERKNYYKQLEGNDTFQKTKLRVKDYSSMNPNNKLIYCDPPYQGTTGYGQKTFDHSNFWNIMRRWSKNNIVFISEYQAPSDFKCIASRSKLSSLSYSSRNTRTERVFVQRDLWKDLKERLGRPHEDCA